MPDTATVPQIAVVIDDDPDVRHLLVSILTSAGFSTIAVDNGVDGVNAVRAHEPALITLDVNMPGIDGFETARRIRAISDSYIVLITALADEADAILGFGVGADDVVVKPFRARELRARLLAMLRRPQADARHDGGPVMPLGAAMAAGVHSAAASLSSMPAPSHVTRHRGLELDDQERIVTLEGRAVTLTRSEFDLLATLLGSGRRVRSKADLVLTLRDESHLTAAHVTDAEERMIEAHITNLRRKLGESAASPRFIETVRGSGYRSTHVVDESALHG